MNKELIIFRNPKSPTSEIFRTLRTNIQFMNTSRKLKILQVTSSFPEEGKSWVAANLAITFAQAGKKVILVDADMRKGRQYTIFGTSPRPGLSNYLSGVTDEKVEDEEQNLIHFIQETEIPNLYLISAGDVPPNPSELLLSTKMLELLEKLKEICDIVIVDGTPCELVADSIILARAVDTSIIVTAHKQTKKDALVTTVKSIQNVGGRVAGVVINKIPTDGKKMEEKYYYYGKKQSEDKKFDLNSFFGTEGIKTTSKREEVQKEIENLPEIGTANNTQNDASTNNAQADNSENSNEEIVDILKQINQYLEKEKNKLD